MIQKIDNDSLRRIREAGGRIDLNGYTVLYDPSNDEYILTAEPRRQVISLNLKVLGNTTFDRTDTFPLQIPVNKHKAGPDVNYREIATELEYYINFEDFKDAVNEEMTME